MLNFQGHKSKDMISLPLGIPDVAVLQVGQNEHGDYIIAVESTLKGTVYQHCGRQITKLHGHGRWIELRHLPILGHRVYVRLQPKQYTCLDCGNRITTQTAIPGGRFRCAGIARIKDTGALRTVISRANELLRPSLSTSGTRRF